MTFKVEKKIRFEGPPTIDQAIEALQVLRGAAGGDALLRVRGTARTALHSNGPYPAQFAAEGERL